VVNASQSTRDKIIAIATEAFATKGFEQSSLREIAEALGFSKAALYYHFRSKEELARAIIVPMTEAFEDVLSAAEGQDNPDHEKLLANIFDLLLSHFAVYRVVMRDASILRAVDLERWSGDWVDRIGAILTGPEPDTAASVRAVMAIGGLARTLFLTATMPAEAVKAEAIRAAMRILDGHRKDVP
jgi:AcrR family transcriptional regulator